MTVKCISPLTQSYLVHRFVHENESIEQLTQRFGRSRRTIIRVLEDHGVDPGIHRRPGRSKPKPSPVTQEALPLVPPLEPIVSPFPGFELHTTLVPTPDRFFEPWYRRLGRAVRQLLNPRTA